ncbi:hypothetical protein ABEV74_14505 [Paenibacillus cisolokensis]|uniref:hypothetical protein n=1 Tax=Paenibacillus cisolokensis TaxID=1658519 RepID=UPI003D2C96D5
MKHKWSQALQVMTVVAIIFLAQCPAVSAENVQHTETLNVAEPLEFAQLVVEGSNDEFETDLILPDGKRWNNGQDDYDKGYVYVRLPQKRIWLLKQLPAGKYSLVVTGPKDSYRSYVKEKIDKPVIQWGAPANTTLTVNDDSPIPLKWSFSGDASGGALKIRFFLQPADGGERFPAGEASLNHRSHDLYIPGPLPDGDYLLTAEGDNYTAQSQAIDPKVKISLSRGVTPPGVEILDAKPAGPRVKLTFKIPESVSWKGLEAVFRSGSQPDKPIVIKYGPEDLTADESQPSVYSIAAELGQNGEYSGVIRWIDAGGFPGPVREIPAFRLNIRDWSKDEVKWSIGDGITNQRMAEARVSVQTVSRVQVVEGTDILFDQTVNPSKDNPAVITIPLDEGDHAIELLIADDDGNVNTYARRWIVDHTPPRLEMIQPLPSHKKMPGGFASGFAEPGSKVWVNGKEAAIDQQGYFKVESVGNKLEIRVADAAGNETKYAWEKASSASIMYWALIAGINLIFISAAFLLYVKLRKKAGDKG